MTTKKTFEAFAKAITRLDTPYDKEIMAQACIEVFQEDNPRFDRERFLDACGLVWCQTHGVQAKGKEQ